MLAGTGERNVAQLLRELDCKIELPPPWRDNFFAEKGLLPTSFDERRRFVRFNWRQKGILYVCDSLPSLSRTQRMHVIYTCNIARSGVGFLHYEQLFPGEICELWLNDHKLTVEVAHCARLGPQCYMLGSQMAARQRDVDLVELTTPPQD